MTNKSDRLRPSNTTNPFIEFLNFGGRRIIILYLTLAFILYMKGVRVGGTNPPYPPPNKICKSIHFIRHAEGIHNRDAKLYADFYQGRHLDPKYHDAPLTNDGHEQVIQLRTSTLLNRPPPELIVSSTLTRALQTARLAFPLPSKIIATDLCRERIASYASDRRRSIGELKKEFSLVDFSLILEEEDLTFDTQKEIHPDPYDSEDCKNRAKRFVSWLIHDRPEQDIVVVTHWVFLSHLLKIENVPDQRIFENAEIRPIQLCRE